MKMLFLILGIVASLLFFLPKTLALENPLNVPNNKYGIHILFPEEIQEAANLVNSKNGDWGYVIIPIQSGDKNIEKWQEFMDNAKKYHIIPIIRLASEGDYFNTKVWRKPTEYDVLDFANFLNSLDWPTKNRYIVVFNEPNRNDEWGGNTDPADYAKILSYTSIIFKSLNENYFIISAGLDNASATIPNLSFNNYDFLQLMTKAVPDVFEKIDGLGSHSYPNPAFSKEPNKLDPESIATFRFENQLIKNYIGRELPVFITETGWIRPIGENKIASYYEIANKTAWSDQYIVAITPFLLKAGAGPFEKFSFLDKNGMATPIYKTYQNLEKQKGEPVVIEKVLGDQAPKTTQEVKQFDNRLYSARAKGVKKTFETVFNWIFKI